jgi:hypothetical protein
MASEKENCSSHLEVAFGPRVSGDLHNSFYIFYQSWQQIKLLWFEWRLKYQWKTNFQTDIFCVVWYRFQFSYEIQFVEGISCDWWFKGHWEKWHVVLLVFSIFSLFYLKALNTSSTCQRPESHLVYPNMHKVTILWKFWLIWSIGLQLKKASGLKYFSVSHGHSASISIGYKYCVYADS